VCILPGIVGDIAEVKPHSERQKYVAWVAMLRQHKRPDLLIEIARKTPNTRFVVCGGPTTFMSPPGYSERIINELRALVNVEFLGQVAPEKAQQVIGDAAIFLSTSDTEGFPNTFAQAWSCGTPVVTLKIDPDRTIEKLRLGAVSRNVERAATDISALIDSPQRRDEIAIRARRFIVENHSAATVVTLFEHALQRVS
jgi:glycosyltransferase involved in cell wall biosynthesis